MTRTRRRFALAAALLCVILVGPIAPASAMPRGNQIFHCRLRATKLGDEITVRFTVNAGPPRHEWRIRIWDGDELIYHRVRLTNARGNITVVVGTDDRRRRDHLEAKARDLTDGVSSCGVDLVV